MEEDHMVVVVEGLMVVLTVDMIVGVEDMIVVVVGMEADMIVEEVDEKVTPDQGDHLIATEIAILVNRVGPVKVVFMVVVPMILKKRIDTQTNPAIVMIMIVMMTTITLQQKHLQPPQRNRQLPLRPPQAVVNSK